MKDSKTMAYINAYAVFGAFENLCELDEEAKKLASPEKPISIRFNVSDGPQAVYEFGNGHCVMTKGVAPCDVHLKLFSTDALNKMLDGVKVTPVPLKGLFKLGFVTNNFTKLGDILTKYLRATPEDLADRAFFEISTKLMANVIAGALCQIGNHDKIGMISASRIPDGDLSFEIGQDVALTIKCRSGKLELVKAKCEKPRAIMKFDSLDTARGIFDGKKDTMTCIGDGTLALQGYFLMLMNLSNILSRVAVYLK